MKKYTIFYEAKDGEIYWDYYETLDPISWFLDYRMTQEIFMAYFLKENDKVGVTEIFASRIRSAWAEEGQL